MMKSPTVSPAMRKSFPKVVGKPQFNFPDKIDNTPKPFEPIIKEKPHSLKPLSTLLMLTDYGEWYYSLVIIKLKPQFIFILATATLMSMNWTCSIPQNIN